MRLAKSLAIALVLVQAFAIVKFIYTNTKEQIHETSIAVAAFLSPCALPGSPSQPNPRNVHQDLPRSLRQGPRFRQRVQSRPGFWRLGGFPWRRLRCRRRVPLRLHIQVKSGARFRVQLRHHIPWYHGAGQDLSSWATVTMSRPRRLQDIYPLPPVRSRVSPALRARVDPSPTWTIRPGRLYVPDQHRLLPEHGCWFPRGAKDGNSSCSKMMAHRAHSMTYTCSTG